MNPKLEVPFDAAGNMSLSRYQTRTVKPNYEFVARLRFVEFDYTRASAAAKMEDVNTCLCYFMYLSEFSKIVQSLEYGEIENRWTFYKRGTAFTLGLAN